MTDGELITGSPTVGKDFERKEEGDSKKFQKESAESSAVIVLNSSSSSHEEHDDFDLDEIQVQASIGTHTGTALSTHMLHKYLFLTLRISQRLEEMWTHVVYLAKFL